MRAARHLLALAITIAYCAIVFESSPAMASDRLALLIGNSRYEHATPLRNPENDIALVEESLKRTGFRTFTSRNVSLQELKHAFDQFVAAARGASKPTLLVYFAGHGVQVNGRNFLIPIDARVDDMDAMSRVSVEAGQLLARLEALNVDLTILVLDACRDDPSENKTRGLQRGLSNISTNPSRLVAFSTAPGKVAFDGDTGTSPYATAFAESILIPGLSLEDMFKRVRKTVFERTQGKQEPWENASLYRKFEFLPGGTSAVIERQEEEFWNLAAIVGSPEAYQRYIGLYPKGAFVSLARLKIDALNKDFTFRRKAETFPVLTATFDDYPRCESEGISRLSDMFDTYGRFNNQVVYIDTQVPFQTLFCGFGEFSYEPVTVLKGSANDCQSNFLISSDEFDSEQVQCRTPQEHAREKGYDLYKRNGKKFDALFAGGGIEFDSAGKHFAIPLGEQPYWTVEEDQMEGNFDEAYVSVKGLARVHYARQEEAVQIYLEPIDPAAIGLTWKLENTLNELSSGKPQNAVTLGGK